MEGFDYERARVELRIPEQFQIEAMAAVGKPGAKEVLPDKLQKRESPNDRRKLTDSILRRAISVLNGAAAERLIL